MYCITDPTYLGAWSCWVLAWGWLGGLLSQGEKAREGVQAGYTSSGTAESL